jgi:hypothetical protein
MNTVTVMRPPIDAVIARSDSDEAIHFTPCGEMDCFACARNDACNGDELELLAMTNS